MGKHVLAGCWWILATCSGMSAEEGRVLTKVSEIRSLSREDAARALPVRLRGVVTWQDSSDRPSFFLHDGEWNIWVDRVTSHVRGQWQGGERPVKESEVGALVEIEGVTDAGGYAPCVIPIRLKRVGGAPLPEAKRVPLERLLSGSEDGQLVEVEGVVQAVSPPDKRGDAKVMLMVDGHPCRVASENAASLVPEKLVDARVRVRGALVPLPNLRAEVAGLRMNVMGAADFEIIEPPPTEPFLAPRVTLNRLLPFTPDANPFHRKVTEGVVVLAVPGQFFFLQQGSSSVYVQSDEQTVRLGDHVEVAGFVDTSQTLASLTGAVVRHLGEQDVPPPIAVSVNTILHPKFRNDFEKVADADYSGRLVRFSGQLVRVEMPTLQSPPRLLVASEGNVFPVLLASSDEPVPSTWVEGAGLELTGVCELRFEEDTASTQGSIDISGFRLWLRSPADIRVTSVPSWWTPQRLALALGGTGVVLALALVWALMLRRQVDHQMAIISDKLRSEAVSTERNRLARDLHDTLEQQLVGVALQLAGAEEIIEEDPKAASKVVLLAGRMLKHTRLEARRSVWDLRSQVLESQGLVAALHALVESVASPAGPRVEFHAIGEPRALPLDADFQLLRVAQEALANALKHAGASTITVTLETTADDTRLTVRDDGRGFEDGVPERIKSPHFGVLGMRERAARIGADLSIQGKQGEGCAVVLTLKQITGEAATS